jgi:2,3-bisphosphoglycerate-independent phosphoglycerate mutase
MFMPRPKPVLLIILDGWGCNPKTEANAIALANPPFYNHLLQTYPHTTLSASGEDVGLPAGQMGNSEVGHMNMGAGRIVYQDFTRINKAISDRSFYANETLLAAISGADLSIETQDRASLHLMGLLSDGGVHSHIDHLIALLEMARKKNVQSLIVHPFLDGRDTPPKSAPRYIIRLEEALKNAPAGADWRIGTVMGRYYAMDRDKRWDRIKKAYDAIIFGKGEKVTSALSAIEQSYAKGITDEFLLPAIICDGEKPRLMQDNDPLLFYNFRADRARQLTEALTDTHFTHFERGSIRFSSYTTLTQYEKSFSFPVAFPPANLDAILGEVLSQHGLRQLRLAETEKYPHVTYFFNGGREIPFELEERKLIPSPRHVATYDQSPEMSADAVSEEAVRQIEGGQFDFIVINFANPDMVGHSGNLKAAIEAVLVIDRCLAKIIPKTLLAGGAVLLTSDHGNIEQMIDYQTGEPHTAHTTLPVPFILASSKENLRLRGGIHANIAPTILDLLQIPKPQQMDQDSLLLH